MVKGDEVTCGMQTGVFVWCRIPPDYAVVIYAVGIQQGGEREWNYLWERAQNTRVASEAEIMMNALAYTQEPWLLWRYRRPADWVMSEWSSAARGLGEMRITSCPFRFVSFRFVSFRFVSFRFVSFRFVSFRFVSFRFVSFRFVSFRFASLRFASLRFASLRFASLRFASFRFVSVNQFGK